MVLTINGERKDVDGDGTVSDLLDELGISPDSVVVERNLNILRKEDFAKETLEDGDAIEIIQMVDGG